MTTGRNQGIRPSSHKYGISQTGPGKLSTIISEVAGIVSCVPFISFAVQAFPLVQSGFPTRR